MAGIRLGFRCGVWKPNAAEWALSMSSIQPEERLRIRQFVFRKHTRSALVSVSGFQWRPLKYTRTRLVFSCAGV